MSRTGAGTGHILLAPSTLLAGRYQIEQVIGTGGMGTVYTARDLRFRTIFRRCAVKEMHDKHSDRSGRERARQNFEREANLLASLNDAAVPKVFDYFAEGEHYYLVYEFIEGQDLARMMAQRGRPVEPQRVLGWGLELTKILTRMHAASPPIIFRDLKPSNIILRPDNHLTLIDFGIAKHFQSQQRGTMIGTEGYAPPEQYEGAATVLVDVYALGATLHHLLTNTDPQEFRPFSFDQRPIRQYNPTVPDALESVISRALAYAPAERWQTMDEFHSALLTLSGGNAPLKHATSPRDSGSSTLRPLNKGSRLLARHEATRGLAAAQRQGTAEGGEVETRPIEAPPAAPPQFAKEPPSAPRRATESDESTRAISAPPEPAVASAPRSAPAPAAVPTVDPAPVPLWSFATEDEVRSTPELTGQHLFIGSYDSNLYCLERETGEFVWKYATTGGIPGTPCVAGDLVIIGSEDQRLYALDRRTGQPLWQAQTQGRIRSSPRVMMDFVIVGSDDGHLYALRADRGHLMWKSNLNSPVRSTPVMGDDRLFVGVEDGAVVGIELMTGKVLWRVQAGGAVVGSPQIMGDHLVVGSMDRQLYKIDQRSGWVIWRVRLADRIYASPAVADGLAYACSVDGTLYCIEPEWGREQWKLSLGTQVTSSPVISDRMLFVGGIDGALYAVDLKKKRVQWRYPTGGALPGSPRVVGNRVYIGSMDHRVYALPTTAPAATTF